MTIGPDNYLDMGNLLVNEIVGDPVLFLILGAAVIIFIGLRFRLDFKATTGLLVLFLVGFSGYIYNQMLLALAILLVGAVGYGTYSRFINK